MCGPLRAPKLLAKRLERGGIAIVAVDVAELPTQLVERFGIESAVLRHAVARAGAKLVESPSCLGDAHDWHVEVAPLRHRLQRREYLLVREIARCAEED